MDYEHRQLLGLYAVVMGPLFIAMGWLAVASPVGPPLMIAGALHLAAAPLLRPTFMMIAAAPMLFGLCFGWRDVIGTVA